jgi:hypothetical protein
MKKISSLLLLFLILSNHQMQAQDLTSINVGTTLPLYTFNSSTKVISAQMSVRNRGFFDSTDFDVALFVVNTNTNTEYEIDRVTYGGLPFSPANNGNTLQITNWTVDLDDKPQVPSGTYRLQARINDNQNATESNYSNNREFFGSMSFVYTATLGVIENPNNVNAFIIQNPVQNILKIDSSYSISEVILYDMFGKIVIANQISDNSFDVSYLKQGMYIIKIRTENDSTFTSKFIKE